MSASVTPRMAKRMQPSAVMSIRMGWWIPPTATWCIRPSARAIGAAGYKVEYDIDRDGDIDSNDRGLVSGDGSQPTPAAGQISAQGNLVGYDGYIFEPATGMYCVRHRWYLPELGRWGRRDPANFADGSSLYQYGISSPIVRIDSYGLCVKKYEYDESDCRGGSEKMCIFLTPDCTTAHLWEMNGIRNEAFEAEKEVCGSNQRNNKCDAFRHCFWSCLMAVETSNGCAKVIGNCHEACSGSPQAEKDMDLHNNKMGREIAKSCEKNWGDKAERDCCFNKCKAAMKDGSLKIKP